MSKTNDIYKQVTDSIIAALERGTKPWVRPWHKGIVCRPLRHNGVAYTGINIIMLWMRAELEGFHAPYWMTYKQAADLGGQVSKGEKSQMVVYANTLSHTQENEEGEEETTRIPYLKTYNVFNVEQIEGLPEHFYTKIESKFSPLETIKHADEFIYKTGANIKHGGNRAYYAPTNDFINIPSATSFSNAEAYTATLCHELTHWTGHKSRLDRLTNKSFGTPEYAKEELIAELGAAFLCADLEIMPMLEHHASYINSWLEVLKKDKRAIFSAASKAQKAAEYLHSLQQ